MIKIAVLGYGVVGSGVVQVLDMNSDIITHNAGQEITVKYILDIRSFSESPYKHLFTESFETIVNDPEITVVVEAIGGVDVALTYTRRCLEAGKNVVTSNKELVSEYGSELLRLARDKDVNYLFEASVGGGIPVIRPLTQCMTANTINEIYGILNGTTNYILTDMERNNAAFSAALREAQQKGYAESDPTADIEGFDTCRKICILASLAFGVHIYPRQVTTEGITGITIHDIAYADKLGYKIKLLGRARLVGNKISAYVAPHLISRSNLLAVVEDVMNGVVIRGNAVGNVVFCGKGAGKLPTASAVVADVIDAVKHLRSRRWIDWADGSAGLAADSTLLDSAWYIRTDASHDKIEREFGSVIFAENTGSETAFITSVMNENMVEELLSRGVSPKSQFRVLGDH